MCKVGKLGSLSTVADLYLHASWDFCNKIVSHLSHSHCHCHNFKVSLCECTNVLLSFRRNMLSRVRIHLRRSPVLLCTAVHWPGLGNTSVLSESSVKISQTLKICPKSYNMSQVTKYDANLLIVRLQAIADVLPGAIVRAVRYRAWDILGPFTTVTFLVCLVINNNLLKHLL